MALLDEIRAGLALRNTATRITHRDGTQYEERRADGDGSYEVAFVRKGVVLDYLGEEAQEDDAAPTLVAVSEEDDDGEQSAQEQKQDEAKVEVEAFHAPRFDVSQASEKEEFLNYLDEHGFAVVKSVADVEQVAAATNTFWDFCESIPGTRFRRDDPNSCEFMWSLRLLPKVRAAFEAIWGTSELVTSFDGANAFRPWRRNPEWLTSGGWWHTDQNHFVMPGRVCVQGLCLLTAATAETGGLCVIPGSHRQHEEMCARNPHAAECNHFVPVELREDDPRGILICAEAGDLVVWDSRTIHCNTPADLSLVARSLQERPHDAQDNDSDRELLRIAGYVCMTPRSWCDEAVLQSRLACYATHTPTSHWPHRPHVASVRPPHGLEPNDIELAEPAIRALI